MSDSNVDTGRSGHSATHRLLGIGLVCVISIVVIFGYLQSKPGYVSEQVASATDARSIDPTIYEGDLPQVTVSSSLGTFRIELYPSVAPDTVERFVKLVDSGYFDSATYMESLANIGFVMAKVDQQTAQQEGDDEAGTTMSARGSVAILKQKYSSAYLNNIFIGYSGHSEYEDRYVIFGRVVEGLDEIETNARTKKGMVQSIRSLDS